MCVRRLMLLFVLAIVVLGGNGYSDETGSNNKIELVPTHRSGIEKVLQGLAAVVSPGIDSSEGRSGFGRLLGSLVPKPIKKIINPVKTAGAKGFGAILNRFEDHFHAIFPGTLWCGDGNIAASEEDVGLFERTDACCRAHDNCPTNINAGESMENLLNNGIFTRSACFCDNEFYQCLKDVGSVVSANIGATYFNILRPQCFTYDYPIESCTEYGKNRILDKKCKGYNLDHTRNKTLEWFDNPDF